MPRYLTKSRFKLASECPTKLFYTGKRDQYADQSNENAYLMILAEGGFQVGELAKLYHPGGVDVPELDHGKALAKTAALLQQDEVVIFEAAFAYEQLFIRVDVLIKKGRQVATLIAFTLFEAATILTQGGGVSTKRCVSTSGSPGLVISIRSSKSSTIGPAPVMEKSW